MNISSSALFSAKSLSAFVLPDTTSGRLKSGAVVPKSNIVESVLAMAETPKLIRVIFHTDTNSITHAEGIRLSHKSVKYTRVRICPTAVHSNPI